MAKAMYAIVSSTSPVHTEKNKLQLHQMLVLLIDPYFIRADRFLPIISIV